MLLAVHYKTLKALVKLVELEMTAFCISQRFSLPLLAQTISSKIGQPREINPPERQ